MSKGVPIIKGGCMSTKIIVKMVFACHDFRRREISCFINPIFIFSRKERARSSNICFVDSS